MFTLLLLSPFRKGCSPSGTDENVKGFTDKQKERHMAKNRSQHVIYNQQENPLCNMQLQKKKNYLNFKARNFSK